MKLLLNKNSPLNFLPFLFVFIASLYRPYDADLGWHLKYGEYFFKTGTILKENTFSTEMPDFIWANTSWGIDLLYYSSFYLLGFFGLTLLSAALITLTFFFFSKAYNLTFWQKSIIFPILVFFESPVTQISFRGQVLSVMMLAVLMLILNSYDQHKKKKILLAVIPLFLFWANLHGQFILGFGIFIIWIFFYFLRLFLDNNPQFKIKNLFIDVKDFTLRNLSEVRFLLLTLILTFLATLIHPFGLGIYTNAFLHFGNRDLQSIMEYLPFEDLTQPWWNQMIFGILLLLGLIYLFFSDQLKKIIPDLGVLAILYSLSWWVRRYAWSMYYLGIPLIKPLADFIKPDSEKNTFRASTVLFIIYVALAIHVKQPFDQYFNMDWDIYCKEYTSCSPKAIQFLIDNKLDKNLLTMYNWGGYMIWNYPQIKPSIDGRMHLWRDEKGYSAFSKYYSLEQNMAEIEFAGYDAVLMGNEKPVSERLEELVEEGKWEKKYEDEFAGVFVRVKDSQQ